MRRDAVLVGVLALLFMGALGLSGWALYDRFQQTNDRRVAQQAFNARVQSLSLDYCREIERLKKGERDRAIQARKDLRRNLALLGIRFTPAIRDAANETKFKALARYAPEPCPRPERGA